jgi:hypothetical protein
LTERVGDQERCPHCNGIAGVVPHDELVRVCKLCGAPRITMPAGVPLGEVALSTLKKADKARKARGLFTGLGIVGGIGTAAGVLLALIIGLFGLTYGIITLLLFAGPALAMALISNAKRGAKTKEVAAALDAAWGAAAAEVVRSGKGATVAELAKSLSIDPVRARELHTLLSVDAEIGGVVGQEAQVRIDTRPAHAEPGGTLPPDPRFAELEQRAAAEAAADAEAAEGDDRAAHATRPK